MFRELRHAPPVDHSFSSVSDWAKGMSDQVLASAKEASGRDFTLADTANAIDMWNRYRKTYKPVEDQTVKDAAGYDSQNWTKIGMGAAG